MVLATLVVSQTQVESINKGFALLRSKVVGWGIDLSAKKWELKTADILGGRKERRRVGEGNRRQVLRNMRNLVSPKMHFAMVVINKESGRPPRSGEIPRVCCG